MSGKAIKALKDPNRLYSLSEALSKPSPTPSGPGIYAWYFKEVPGITPADGCVTHDGLTLLYVGISPRNESSSQNLRKRIRQHFGGNAEGSTLRKTLGVLLTEVSGFPLVRVGSGRRITFTHLGDRWMDANAVVCWLEHPRPHEVEADIIRELCLPLNIQDNKHHPFASVLSKLRRSASQLAREGPIASETGQQRRPST